MSENHAISKTIYFGFGAKGKADYDRIVQAAKDRGISLSYFVTLAALEFAKGAKARPAAPKAEPRPAPAPDAAPRRMSQDAPPLWLTRGENPPPRAPQFKPRASTTEELVTNILNTPRRPPPSSKPNE